MERRTRGMANRTGRVMNSAMNISLPIELHEELREIAWASRMPSHLCRDLLQEGLKRRREEQEDIEVETSVSPTMRY